ncbi:MAG: helix-turn-helix transcriptional regulator [Reichenbachiella sp.]
MMILNVSRMLTIRGVQKPYNYLKNLGFSHKVVHRMLSNKAGGIKMYQLEKLCLSLHCTPDDLMTWEAGNESVIVDHPIMKLVHGSVDSLTVDQLRKLPLHKLDQLKEVLMEME